MPPKFEPPDEDEILRQAKRLQRMADGGILSNKTVITTTIASAFAGLCAIIYVTWYITKQGAEYLADLRGIDARLIALTAEVRNGKDRWRLGHEAEIWQDFERRNRMLKLDMPDPYATKLKLGD